MLYVYVYEVEIFFYEVRTLVSSWTFCKNEIHKNYYRYS